MALQKIFLLPPLKGLNLYDNPFTMDPAYATELVNYMPPTTTLTVRPAIEFLLCIYGNVRGLYSYNVGRTTDYGADWWSSNITYGASNLILSKTLDKNGKVFLWSIDPVLRTYKQVGTMSSQYYNDDSVMYKHTLFLASGDSNSAMKLFNEQKGTVNFALRIGNEGQTEIGNIQNITIFKNFIFMSGNDSLNIYYIKAESADILDPINSFVWKQIDNIFSPKFGGTFSLDGTCQHGGTIIKLFNMSRGGADTINTYLIAITSVGEIIMFDGTDPSDTTGQKWQISGRFQISPPLNKFCVCEMDGDVIVATKNGFISLRRVIFGQSSQVIENLEYRLMSIFMKYQFRIPSYSDFIGLYYHPRNRLLIFNVPTSLPMPFQNVEIGLEFQQGDKLIFFKDFFTENIITQFCSYILGFNIKNCITTEFIIEFDGDYNHNAIVISTTTDWLITKKIFNIYIELYIIDNKVKTNLLENPLVFEIEENDGLLSKCTLKSEINWNNSLKVFNADQTDFQYEYVFKNSKTITNIFSSSKVFRNRIGNLTLSNITLPTDFYQDFNIRTKSYFLNLYKNEKKPFYINLDEFFNSRDWGWFSYTIYTWQNQGFDKEHFPPQIPNDKFPTYVSFLRSFVYHFTHSMLNVNTYAAGFKNGNPISYENIKICEDYRINFNFHTCCLLKRTDGTVKYALRFTIKIVVKEILVTHNDSAYTVPILDDVLPKISQNYLYEFRDYTKGENWEKVIEFSSVKKEPEIMPADNFYDIAPYIDNDNVHRYRGILVDKYFYDPESQYIPDIKKTPNVLMIRLGNVFMPTLDMSDVKEIVFSENANDTTDNFFSFTATSINPKYASFQSYIDLLVNNVISDFGDNNKYKNLSGAYLKLNYIWSNFIFEDFAQPQYEAPPLTPKSVDPGPGPGPTPAPDPTPTPTPDPTPEPPTPEPELIRVQSIGTNNFLYTSDYYDVRTSDYAYNVFNDDDPKYKYLRTLDLFNGQDFGVGTLWYNTPLIFGDKRNTRSFLKCMVNVLGKMKLSKNDFYSISGEGTFTAKFVDKKNNVFPIYCTLNFISNGYFYNNDKFPTGLCWCAITIRTNDTTVVTLEYSIRTTVHTEGMFYVTGSDNTKTSGSYFKLGEGSYFIMEGGLEWKFKVDQDSKNGDLTEEFKGNLYEVIPNQLPMEMMGYLLAGFVLEKEVVLKEEKVEEKEKNNVEVSSNEKIPILSITDLHTQVLLSGIELVCPFRSEQYVFDSHFGTWSQFKDINMMKGIESNSDFYFVIPNDITFDRVTNSYNVMYSSFCRFNPNQLGDHDISSLTTQYLAIKTSYKTVPTFDFQNPQKKFFKRIKIFGTKSAFWQPRQYPNEPYPFIITPYSDFREGNPISFVHAFDTDSIVSSKILKRHFKGIRSHSLLKASDVNKFWQVYLNEIDLLTNISIPLVSNPGTRFGLKLEMDLMEAFVSIYGFEIFFEPSGQIL